MGKGSALRTENLTLVHEGYSRIFGESKLEKRLREERAAGWRKRQIMDSQSAEDELDEPICPNCRAELAVTPNKEWLWCDVCGHRSRLAEEQEP